MHCHVLLLVLLLGTLTDGVRSVIPRIVYIMENDWKMPGVLQQRCLRKLVGLNRGWHVRAVTPGNIEQYLCTGQEVGACDLAALGLDHTNVEQLKVAVMRKTGGVWWDATLYPTMKLDQWVVSNTKLVDAATGTVLVLAAEQGAVSAGAKSLSDAAAQS